MNKPVKKIISMILCILMCISIMPISALGADSAAAPAPAVKYAVKNAAPKVTSDPKSVTTSLSEKVTLTVTASGKSLKYQWYYRTSTTGSWKKLSGKTKATLTLTAAQKLNGNQYRCQVSNSSGKVYSKAATLKVLNFTIKTHPADKTVARGASVSIKTKVSGSGLKYQWQYRTSASGSWKTLSGKTKATLTFTAAKKNNGYQYRCRITNSKGSAYTKAATLKVTGFSIDVQPADQAVSAGETAVFAPVVSGAVDAYQWYQRADADSAWQAIETDGDGASLSVLALPELSGYQYRCRLTDSVGSVYTAAAVLTVADFTITAQPEDQILRPGDTAEFSVTADGPVTGWQWYSRASASAEWKALSGETGPTLTFIAEAGQNGREYRCELSSSVGRLFSQTAVLTVVDTTITAQPADAAVRAGENAVFTVETRGEALSRQWYTRTSADSEWILMDGQTEATLTFVAEAAMDGSEYRCEIRDELGSTWSEAASLHVVTTVITAQPADRTVAAGESAAFTVTVEGKDLTYRWYYRSPSHQEWTALNNTNKPTYTISAKAGHDNYEFYCEITDELGVLTSEPALLRVVSVTTPPADQTVRVGKSASFAVTARGPVESYRWQYRDGAEGTWTDLDGQSERTLTFTAEAAQDGYEYRCGLVYDGGVLYSNGAVLDVLTADYRALLVGEVNFPWADGSRETANRNRSDVELMQTMLQGIQGPEEASYAVTTLLDASTAQIGAAIQSTFAGATEDDVSLFFIASHGVTNVESGGNAGAIVTVTESSTEYLTMPQLAAWLNAVPGKVIVFIGSCGSGAAVYSNGLRANAAGAADETAAFTQSVVSAFSAYGNRNGIVSNTGEFRTSKFYVLTAAAHMESSWGTEGSSVSYNFFTYYLTRGVNGAMPADTGKDSTVDLQELYVYLQKYATGPYYDGETDNYQHVQVYPENSTYPLFKK